MSDNTPSKPKGPTSPPRSQTTSPTDQFPRAKPPASGGADPGQPAETPYVPNKTPGGQAPPRQSPNRPGVQGGRPSQPTSRPQPPTSKPQPPSQYRPGQPPSTPYKPSPTPPPTQYRPGQTPPQRPPGQPKPPQPSGPYKPSQPRPTPGYGEQPPTPPPYGGQLPTTPPRGYGEEPKPTPPYKPGTPEPPTPPSNQYDPSQPPPEYSQETPEQPGTGEYAPTAPYPPETGTEYGSEPAEPTEPSEPYPTEPPETGYEPGEPGETPPEEQPDPYGGYPPMPYPDPCDETPWWGPPRIPAECWPADPGCCGEGGDYAWGEVEDACVRAAAWQPNDSAKVTCTCSSDKPACCDEWECGGYPENICVPCKPCRDLLPEDENGGDTDGDEPPADGCTGDLQRAHAALKKSIVSRQTEKAKLDAQIKADTDGEKELGALVNALKGFVKAYRDSRDKLICREDCLKRFHREYQWMFAEKLDCVDLLQTAINDALGRAEQIKCCQKSLEGKLTRPSRLVRERDEADKTLKRTEAAFKSLQELQKWIGEQFTALEKLHDDILKALNDPDPEKHKWAFYLFYWKFVPLLCRKFPVPFCCDGGGYDGDGAVRIGCAAGDWHPSKVAEEDLERLICCALQQLKKKREDLQTKNALLDKHTKNLEFIKTQVLNEEGLDKLVKADLEKVACAVPTPREPEASAQ